MRSTGIARPPVRPIAEVSRRAAIVDVAVAIVRDASGRVLVAERTARQIAAGYWELPGGKIEPGEDPGAAAARELVEETGLVATAMRPAIVYEHRFRTKLVRLHAFYIDAWSGEAHGREGQRLAWIDPAQPSVSPLLPSNERIMLAMGLPALYVTAPPAFAPAAAWAPLADLLARAPALVGTGEAGRNADARVVAARRVVDVASAYGALVVVHASALEARRSGAIAIHSSAAEMRRFSARPPIALWIVTCHDDADVERAVMLGADAAVAAPPDRATGGWDGVRRMAGRLRIPVYAPGDPAELADARRAGAIGVAFNALSL